jgi:AcrR family transcriptional regulator
MIGKVNKSEYRSEMTRTGKHDPAGRRQAILQAAADLFVQYGYEGASIADIAKRADVAVGSVYRQFPDKVALLSALHKDLEFELITVMEKAWNCDKPYHERFEPMFAALFRALTKRHAIMPILAMTTELVGEESYTPGKAMITAIRKMYQDGVAAGELRAYPMQVLPSILHGMVNGALSAWAANPSTRNERVAVAALRDVAQAIGRV